MCQTVTCDRLWLSEGPKWTGVFLSSNVLKSANPGAGVEAGGGENRTATNQKSVR